MNITKNKTEPFKFTGNWAEQSKQLKVKFPQLTDADLKFETGKEEDVLARVEKKLNKKREELSISLEKGSRQKFCRIRC